MTADSRHSTYRPLIVAGVLLVLVVVLAMAANILIPIAFGILLSFVLNPAVAMLQSRGLRRTQAALIVVFLTAIITGGMLTALAIQLRDLARELPTHKDQISQKVHDLVGHEPGIFGNITRMLDEISIEMQGVDTRDAKKPAITIPVRIQQERSPGFGLLSVLAGPLSRTLGAVSLTIGLTISMLILREDLRNRLFLLLGDGQLTTTTRALDDVSKRISGYLFTQVVLNTAFGIVFGLGLEVIGVRYAYVWGVLAGVLRFVPYIGTWLAAVFPLLMSIAVAGWMQLILVGGWTVLLGVLANSVLEPMLISRTTGVTPIALVISTAFWTWLWGPIGLILATPMTVCLCVLGKHVPSLRFLDILLGSAAPLEPDMKFYQRLLARDEVEAADLLEEYLVAHPAEELLDKVIGPALGRARIDRERGHLSDDELAAVVRITRELADVVLPDPEAVETEKLAPDVLLLASPTHDELDTLALELFARVLLPTLGRMKIVGTETTAAEVVSFVEEEHPAVVCLGGIPPAGGARGRYLCKRLRSRFEGLPIVAALLGGEGGDQLAQQLKGAGASQVARSFAEARQQIAPLMQVASHLEQV